MKKILLVANWKMNPATLKEARQLYSEIEKDVKDAENVDIVICPPFVYLSELQALSSKIQIGAQNCFWEEKGPFTGEVSPHMLKNLGCSHVIIGHSERKTYLYEDFVMIYEKVQAVLQVGLTPVICIGEKKKGTVASKKSLEAQVRGILGGSQETDMSRFILVYEPEWAISTTTYVRVPTPQDLQKTVSYIRHVLSDMFGVLQGERVRILYGGSVDSKNIEDFLHLVYC